MDSLERFHCRYREERDDPWDFPVKKSHTSRDFARNSNSEDALSTPATQADASAEPGRSNISVALCTCNGERYLPEQLQSILSQTRLPDEVIVGDDGSTDGTLALLDGFAEQAPFPVTVLGGEGRLGSTRNFERVLRRCRCAFIALCDQDDVWTPKHLEQLASQLELHPEVSLVFSNAHLMDANGALLPCTLWQSFGFSDERQRALASGDYRLLVRERFVTGATAMLRQAALEHALPIPPVWIHDAWLACILSFHGDLLALDEPLLHYRVHARQQVGTGVSLWKRDTTRQADAHWERIYTERRQLEMLLDFLAEHPPSVRTELLEPYKHRADFLRVRSQLANQRLARVIPILRNWIEYRQQAGGLPSIVKDLLFAK